MIEVEGVWDLIDRFACPLPAERLPLDEALGLTLAEDIAADRDGPPFDRATVDGYAIGAEDDSETFVVVAEIAAGDFVRRDLRRGEAFRIFTGAPLPSAGLRIVMQEDAARAGDAVRFSRRDGRNFSARGEDFRAGDRLVAAGARIDAAAAGVLASVGATRPLVIRPPRVLHFTTGDEIVPPECSPAEGQIRDGNAPLIRGLLSAFPRADLRHAHLPDDEEAARRLMESANPEAADLVLFSGGASVGDRDFTPRFLDALGFTRHGGAVNVRPGKPLIFAEDGTRLAFGLPGNPVSHFVCFHVFVARALARRQGRSPATWTEALLAAEIPGRPNPRVTFWPARRMPAGVRLRVGPVAWNSSGHLASLVGVDALIRLEANAALPNVGGTVQILCVA